MPLVTVVFDTSTLAFSESIFEIPDSYLAVASQINNNRTAATSCGYEG